MKEDKKGAKKALSKEKGHVNTQLDELEFLREKEGMTLEEYEAQRRQILGDM